MFGLWGRRALEARIEALEAGSHSEARAPDEAAISNLVRATTSWGDNFGYFATRSLQVLIVLGITALSIIGMRQLTTVVIPVLLALILASTFSPVMIWQRRKGVPPALATVFMLLAIVLIFTGVGWLIVWAVRDQWDELALQVNEGFTHIVEWWNSSDLVNTLPFTLDEAQIKEWTDTVVSFVTSAQFGSGALAGVGFVTNFITGLVLTIVVLFFFLKDGPKIWHFMLRPFTGEGLARAERVGDKTVATLGAYIRGTAGVAAVDAIGIWIGLVILQVPLAVPLAVLVFFLAFIPLVGATLAGVLAALVALVANGPVSALLVIGVVVLVNQLEGNFLQPVLMGRALKLHALVILLALTVGTVLAGILGAVLAVPIAAVLWGIIQVWDGPGLPAKWFRAKPVE